MGSLALQGAGSVSLPGLNSTGSTGGSFDDWGAVLPLGQPLLDGGAASSAIDGAQQQARPRAIALEQARQLERQFADERRAGRLTGAPPRCPAALPGLHCAHPRSADRPAAPAPDPQPRRPGGSQR